MAKTILRRTILKFGVTAPLSSIANRLSLGNEGTASSSTEIRANFGDRPINVLPQYCSSDAQKYGVIADGQTDNHSAIKLGLNALSRCGGGVLKLPPGEIRVSRPITLESNVLLCGDGYSTHLHCDGSSSKGPERGLVVMFGSMDADSFSKASFVSLRRANAGDHDVILLDRSEIECFAAGQLAWIWESGGYFDSANHFRPRTQQIMKIVSVDRVTGCLRFEAPLYKDIPTGSRLSLPEHTKTRSSIDPFMTESAGLANLRVSAAGNGNEAWTRFGGAYRAQIENLWIENSNVCFSANGFAYSTIRRLRGTFNRKICDIAYFCHHNTIADLIAGPGEHANKDGWGIRFSEGAHHNVVKNVVAELGSIAENDAVITFGQGSYKNIVQNSVFSGQQAKTIVSARNRKRNSALFGDNIISRSNFSFDTARDFLLSHAYTDNSRPSFRIHRSRLLTQNLERAAIEMSNSGIFANGCEFTSDRGYIRIGPDSSGWGLVGNRFTFPLRIHGGDVTIRRINTENQFDVSPKNLPPNPRGGT